MKESTKKWVRRVSVIAVVAVVASASYMGFRAKRAYDVFRDWRAQIRYAVANNQTIGEERAARTFEAGYLEAVFGGEPALMDQLRVLIAKGIAEDPTINLGEVTAMIVTYTKAPDGKIEDVAAHVMGGFEIGKRRPGFNRDGYFAAQIDRNLWNTGNTLLSMLGRDMIVFADPKVSHFHDEILEAVLSGDIGPLTGVLTNRALYFTAVFPDPKRAMPTQLRAHVQTLIIKGRLATDGGSYDAMFLAREPKSAGYAASILGDLRLSALLALRMRMGGAPVKTDWGDHVPTWWAHEMASTLDAAVLDYKQSIVSFKTTFGRRMVNANMKSIERMGRDMAAMRLIRDDRLDPRLADKRLASGKPLNYWSDAHRWGPDWPIAAPTTNGTPSEQQQK